MTIFARDYHALVKAGALEAFLYYTENRMTSETTRSVTNAFPWDATIHNYSYWCNIATARDEITQNEGKPHDFSIPPAVSVEVSELPF
jgi:hypothetical protein